MTPTRDAFELGMHSAFKAAGVKTAKEAHELMSIGNAMLAQQRQFQSMSAAFELGLRKVAADHGLLTTEEQDAFVEAARKVSSEKLALGFGGTSARDDASNIGSGISGLVRKLIAKIKEHPVASAGAGGLLAGGVIGSRLQKKRDQNKLSSEKTATIGALVGALRKKDPGESRGKAIMRSMGTDLATSAGAGAGAVGGGLLGARLGMGLAAGGGGHATKETLEELLHKLVKGGLKGGLIGGAALGAAGGAGAYQLAKRRPQKKQGLLDLLKAKLGK
jgi:hypothetical protein